MIISKRKSAWIGFARAFFSTSTTTTATSNNSNIPHNLNILNNIRKDDDSGLNLNFNLHDSNDLIGFGQRLKFNHSNLSSDRYRDRDDIVPTLSSTAPSTSSSTTINLSDRKSINRNVNLLFNLDDNLRKNRVKNQRRHRNRIFYRRFKPLSENRYKFLKKLSRRRIICRSSTSNSFDHRLEDLKTSLKTNNKKLIRCSLRTFSWIELFNDTNVINTLIPGLMFNMDIKSLSFLIEKVNNRHVRITERNFIILLNGFRNIQAVKIKRDQGRNRRSYILLNKHNTFDHNRFSNLTKGMNSNQHCLISTIPLRALQRGLFVMPQSPHEISKDLGLSCIKYLLRVGYEQSATLLCELKLKSLENDEKNLQKFGVHSLNIFLKSLLNFNNDPIGPKFENSYKPSKYFKNNYDKYSVFHKSISILRIFKSTIPNLKLNVMTFNIILRIIDNTIEPKSKFLIAHKVLANNQLYNSNSIILHEYYKFINRNWKI